MEQDVLTEDEKQEALTHLLYDYGMVLGCRLAPRLRRGRPIESPLEERLYRKALLESLTIRWRSLMDFFYGHAKAKRHPNDVCTFHYLPPWPSDHEPSTVPDYKALRRRVDVQIAQIGRAAQPAVHADRHAEPRPRSEAGQD